MALASSLPGSSAFEVSAGSGAGEAEALDAAGLVAAFNLGLASSPKPAKAPSSLPALAAAAATGVFAAPCSARRAAFLTYFSGLSLNSSRQPEQQRG